MGLSRRPCSRDDESLLIMDRFELGKTIVTEKTINAQKTEIMTVVDDDDGR